MTKTELNKFKQILEAKHSELEQAVRDRDGIVIEKSPESRIVAMSFCEPRS